MVGREELETTCLSGLVEVSSPNRAWKREGDGDQGRPIALAQDNRLLGDEPRAPAWRQLDNRKRKSLIKEEESEMCLQKGSRVVAFDLGFCVKYSYPCVPDPCPVHFSRVALLGTRLKPFRVQSVGAGDV